MYVKGESEGSLGWQGEVWWQRCYPLVCLRMSCMTQRPYQWAVEDAETPPPAFV